MENEKIFYCHKEDRIMILTDIDIVLAILIFLSIFEGMSLHSIIILKIGLFLAGINILSTVFYSILSYE
jgi:hypothetical protein